MDSFFSRLSSVLILFLFLSLHLCSFGQLAKERPDIFDTDGKPPIPAGSDTVSIPVRAAIGYTVLQIRTVGLYGGSVTIPVAVWYPTTSVPNRFDYQYVTNHVLTEVAVDGEPTSGVHPLVIYSHGATGSGLSSAFVEESLARSGFVVAAPDHTDSTTLARILPDDNPRRDGVLRKLADLKYVNEVRSDLLGENAVADRPELSYRPAQVRSTISALLANPRFSSHIDPKQIGLFGHSFGAWTTMMISGPVPEYGDPRVKAAVVLSAPVNPYVFSGAELARIHIPMMMMFGEKEVGEGRGDDRGLFYDRMTCPKYLLEIAGADHFTFSGGVKEEYPAINDYLSQDGRRAAITRYTVAFFRHYFGNDPAADRQLNIRGSGIAGYIRNAP